MLTMFFGEKKEPCGDCTKIEGKWYCTMNCGPCVPPERPAMDRLSDGVKLMEKWEVERDRLAARDATILKAMAAGIDEIVERNAKAMVHHPGLVYPSLNRHVFAEVKACIAQACLEVLGRPTSAASPVPGSAALPAPEPAPPENT